MADESIFRQLQLLVESVHSVESSRKDLLSIVHLFQSMPYHDLAIKSLCIERQLDEATVRAHDVFFVSEDTVLIDIPEELRAEALGMVYKKYITMLGRMVYPVKDVKGQVMGFCGWDYSVSPKYLDSKNHGYKAKATTLFGMERLPEYYINNKKIFVLEGIVDSVYLRSKGYCAMSLLGSYMTPYVITILQRLGRRLVLIPDNDEAGNGLVRQAKWKLPLATIVQAKEGKDVDGCRKLSTEHERRLLSDLNKLSILPVGLEMFHVR